MGDFLYYNTLTPISRVLSMVRGDDVKVRFSHDLGASTSISEARFFMRDSDLEPVVQLTLEANATQWDFTTSDEGILWIKGSDTDDGTSRIAVGNYSYAVELIGTDETTRTPLRGRISVVDDVVYDGDDDDGIALNYASRDELTLLLSSLAATWPFSWTTTDAASGASTVVVYNGAAFTTGNTVRVAQDDGTYLETTVTVANNTLTLADVLTDDVAELSIVRKVAS
jgi:hypothetical protein